MVSLKKAALAVIAFGVTGVASAGMYTPPPAPVPVCTGVNVLVPCERSAWDLGVQALYVQPNSVKDVTLDNFVIDSSSVTDSEVTNFNPEWTWGFRVEGSYHFWTGSDINLNWTYIGHNDDDNNDDNVTVSVGDESVFGRFVGPSVEDDGAWDAVGTEIQQKFNEVNLEYGQTVMFGEHATARFHGGLQWAQIERDITQTGVQIATVDNTETSALGIGISDSKFNGIGPRVGADWSYGFSNGFSIVAHSAAALLVGDTKVNVSQTLVSTVADDASSDVDAAAFVTQNDERSIVPALEGKIGLAYTAAMSQGDLTIEGGYQVTQYWNAVDEDQVIIGSDSINGDFTENDANFAFQGVYLGLKWMGNA